MAMAEAALQQTRYQYRGSSLVDVVDLILDKGLVIDAFVRVSVIGIELLTLDARIVIASIDTYLRFAEAVNRLDLTQTKESTTYEDLVEGGSKRKSEGAIEGAKEALGGGKSDKGQGKEEEEEDKREGVMSRVAKRGRRQ